MRLFRLEIFASLIALVGLMTACSTPEVGAPCLPEQIPADGFKDNEAYIETNSVQCETRVCMVYKLGGDPSEDCNQRRNTNCDPMVDPNCVPCATQEKIDLHTYCTCRCDAPSAAFAECDCPAGYSCETVLKEGGPGVQGGYCVNSRTVNE